MTGLGSYIMARKCLDIGDLRPGSGIMAGGLGLEGQFCGTAGKRHPAAACGAGADQLQHVMGEHVGRGIISPMVSRVSLLARILSSSTVRRRAKLGEMTSSCACYIVLSISAQDAQWLSIFKATIQY